ncbi:MAG: tRNA 2-thiouridine synthesizing protein D [Cryomorphaceae bacterium]|jgi:tRNA 2-thiouridine synthesizing protein D
MQFNILVTGGLYSTQSGYSALRFCESAVAAGHEISQVFFYQDGVSQASALSVAMGDEFDSVECWAKFAELAKTKLVVCVSAGERRGIIGPEQATEFAKHCANLHSSFSVEGLGAFHSASIDSDRTVTFK